MKNNTPVKRNTIQRKLVLDTVLKLKNHPTADEVYSMIVVEHPTISRATVYRNLNLLSDDKVLLRVAVPDGADRFDHVNLTHYHVKCNSCGAFCDVNMEYELEIDEKASNISGFKILNHEVFFDGICSECIQKEDN